MQRIHLVQVQPLSVGVYQTSNVLDEGRANKYIAA